MAEPFVFITTHRVDPAQLDEFTALTREYVEYVTANEPDVWAHLACLDEAGSEVALVQVHGDAASAEHHMQIAGEMIGRGLALATTVTVEVFGEPGPIVRQALEANAAQGIPVTVRAHRLASAVNPSIVGRDRAPSAARAGAG
ncbi:MAG TPA: hypothetical protein VFC33_03045 [Acidimicrobiia bacterium]|nr:hypothetical protein [Acidimicrobiia bacterium]